MEWYIISLQTLSFSSVWSCQLTLEQLKFFWLNEFSSSAQPADLVQFWSDTRHESCVNLHSHSFKELIRAGQMGPVGNFSVAK